MFSYYYVNALILLQKNALVQQYAGYTRRAGTVKTRPATLDWFRSFNF